MTKSEFLSNTFPTFSMIDEKDRKNTNIRSLLSVLLFMAIFGTLLALASVFDLQISKILTKNTLAAGQYYANTGFGKFFEVIGACPIWVLISIAMTIAFWFFKNVKNKPLRYILMTAAFAVGCVGFFFLFFDLLKYCGEYLDPNFKNGQILENGLGRDFAKIPYNLAIIAVLALGAETMLVLAWKNIDNELNKKMFKFAIVIMLTVACYLIIELVKKSVGRTRYRALNALNDDSYFTNWYVAHGFGTRKISANLPSDQCKSFPSGHTFSAGLCYTLICLTDILPFFKKNKWAKGFVWTGTIAYTGIVAISRMVVGAHFMSDVLFGGTIAFLGAMLWREIFVLNMKHFRSFIMLFNKNKIVEVKSKKSAAVDYSKIEK